MIWHRKSKKQLRHEETLAKIEELKSLLVNNEIKKLQDTKIEYERVKKDLDQVKLSVDRIYKGYDDNGNLFVNILYKIDPVQLTFATGDLDFNPTFKAINMLNLISLKDMEKIKKFLDKATEDIK